MKTLACILAVLAINGMAFGLTESQTFDDAASAAAAGWAGRQASATTFVGEVSNTTISGGAAAGEGHYQSTASPIGTPLSYYADESIGLVDPWAMDLQASGTFWIPSNNNDVHFGDLFLGWFNSDSTSYSTGEAMGLMNFTAFGGNIYVAGNGGNGRGTRGNQENQNPDGSFSFNAIGQFGGAPHTFELTWDYDADPGYGGMLSMSIDGGAVFTIMLQQADKYDTVPPGKIEDIFNGNKFDRFGAVWMPLNASGAEGPVEIYFDDLTYTVPEPTAMSLLALGLATIRRRR